MIPCRLIRVFTSADSETEICLSQVYELLHPPRRGEDVQIPEVGERRVARVKHTVRLASPSWEPGYRTLELTGYELEAEDVAGLEAAQAAGWAPA